MVKCKVKTVMTLDNRGENGVKECGVKGNTAAARISKDDMSDILDDINVAQTKRRRPPTPARAISASIQHGENAELCPALLLTFCYPI